MKHEVTVKSNSSTVLPFQLQHIDTWGQGQGGEGWASRVSSSVHFIFTIKKKKKKAPKSFSPIEKNIWKKYYCGKLKLVVKTTRFLQELHGQHWQKYALQFQSLNVLFCFFFQQISSWLTQNICWRKHPELSSLQLSFQHWRRSSSWNTLHWLFHFHFPILSGVYLHKKRNPLHTCKIVLLKMTNRSIHFG